MQITTLVKRSLIYFSRTNLAVVLGVAAAVAVLGGALLVGDSVRGSLRQLAVERLGRTDLVVAGAGFFRQKLADELKADPRFPEKFTAACSMIALGGVVTHGDSNARAGGVQIYGIDENFWKFHGVGIAQPGPNDALVSPALAAELTAKQGDTIILRIEKPSEIPVESLHGRKDDLGSTIRVRVREVLPAGSMGEFSIRPQQGGVRAVYIPLDKLQRNLDQDGKANIILLSQKVPESDASGAAMDLIRERFSLADLGLKLRVLEGAVSLESDAGVIAETTAEAAEKVASNRKIRTSRFLTYLANTFGLGDREMPYSLITAVDADRFPELRPGGLILNEWAARDLGAKVGDRIEIDYFVWRDEGKLGTDSSEFTVSGIVPISGLAADRNLAPEYPGITEARSLSDWDPPFPVDLSRVRKQDEDYWDEYRTTPKAFIPLADGQKLWSTRYGRLTSIRFSSDEPGKLRSELEAGMLAGIDPSRSGLAVQPVRQEGLAASRGATDFGEYFTYFSFFLVVSALLLTTLFFKLGVEQRGREIGLLRALGFSAGRIRGLFLREGAALAMVGSLIGLAGAIGYAALLMYGLRTWWVGAVGTTLLRLHINPLSLLIAFVAGIVTALLCVWLTLRSLGVSSPRNLLSGSLAGPSKTGGRAGRLLSASRLSLIAGLLGIALLGAAWAGLIGQAGGFFGAGTLLLISVLFFWSAWLRSDDRSTIAGHGTSSMMRMGFRNATERPSRTVLCIALVAAAAFIIVSVDAFRRDAGDADPGRDSGTGGYTLMGESLLPIVRNLNDQGEREEMGLIDDELKNVRMTRFRLRPGDDASCLNLYQPKNPRILGASEAFIKEGRFRFSGSLAESEKEKTNPWLLLDGGDATTVPVIVDANSMTYVLHLGLGDEMAVTASDGRQIRLHVVGSLADSVFQSELIMSEENFLKFFPDQEGYRFFMIDAPRENSAGIAAMLEDRLSDFGLDLTSTGEKLAGFHQVENTYLSTFQTLGGLGLLLGTFGLGTVLLRNVLERRRELALLRAVGYRPIHLGWMVFSENLLMLGCGLMTGVLCALLAIAPAWLARGGGFSSISLGLLLLAVFLSGMGGALIAVRAILGLPVLSALRSE